MEDQQSCVAKRISRQNKMAAKEEKEEREGRKKKKKTPTALYFLSLTVHPLPLCQHTITQIIQSAAQMIEAWIVCLVVVVQANVDVFFPQEFLYSDLVNDEAFSKRADDFAAALVNEGMLAVTSIPNYESSREYALGSVAL